MKSEMRRHSRRTTHWLLVTVLCWTVAASSGLQAEQHRKKKIKAASSPAEVMKRFPPMREIDIPEVVSHTLANGMELYLLEDHALPIVNGFASVRTGNLFDPPKKIALAGITGQVLRLGGTVSRTGPEIDEELESMAASVETSIGETSGSANFWTLKENIDRVLVIYADVLMNPAFRQDKIDLIKQQVRSGIARRNDNPGGIATREFTNLVYGRQTPYGWQLEYEHVDRIEKADLEGFYQRYFFPANIKLAVYGDFSSDEMKAKVEKAFENWTVEQPSVPPFPEVERKDEGGLYLAEKQDVNQSNIRIGHLGGLRKDEDYPALRVMAGILGGGFQSRLFQRIRSDLGLVYSVGASWGANYDHPGIFRVGMATKSESTVQAIEEVMGEIERIRNEPVTDAELRTAKESVLNSFVFNFDTKGKTLGRLMRYVYWGYPKDFIFQYRDKLAAVTKEDVQRVAKEYLHPKSMKLVVVGKPSDFDRPLEELGEEVHKIDLTIPQPEQELAQADDSTLAKGIKILLKAQEAAGGADKLAAVKDLTRKGKLEGMGGMMTAEQTTHIILPDVLRQEMQLPFGAMVIFAAGDSGWRKGPRGQAPLGGPLLKQAQEELFRVRESLLLSDRDPERKINFVESGEVDGKAADVIEISAHEGFSVKLWIDSSSGDILKTAYQGAAMSGAPAEVEEIFSDYREVDGIRIPFKTKILQNGKDFAELTVSEAAYNSGLEKEVLSQP